MLAALWGSSFLFMRIAAPILGPVWLIELRVLLAGLALLPLVFQLKLWPQLRQNWQVLTFVGAINLAIPFSLFAFASLSLPAGFTSILNATTPLFGSAIAAIVFGERFTLTRGVGFSLGFIGVAVLVGWPAFPITPAFFSAVAAGLFAALLYAIAAPYVKQRFVGMHAIAFASGSHLGAALSFLPLLPLNLPSQAPTPEALWAVLGLALLCSALAYILYFRLLARMGATNILTVAYLVPLFAMLWGALFLQERVTPAMLLGCGLVLLGTAIANDLGRRLRSKWGKD